ncbi:hypothetical protein Droror1_Dr00003048 [Drosera rotundifolia]
MSSTVIKDSRCSCHLIIANKSNSKYRGWIKSSIEKERDPIKCKRIWTNVLDEVKYQETICIKRSCSDVHDQVIQPKRHPVVKIARRSSAPRRSSAVDGATSAGWRELAVAQTLGMGSSVETTAGRQDGCGRSGHKARVFSQKKPLTSDSHSGGHRKRGKSKRRSASRNRDMSKVQCYYCKDFGHMKSHCPKLSEKRKNDKGKTPEDKNDKQGNMTVVEGSDSDDNDTHLMIATQSQDVIQCRVGFVTPRIGADAIDFRTRCG